MNQVIAICGPSAVGKSAVAKELGALLAVAPRYCGEVVKAYAQSRGLSLDELSAEQHNEIDAETRRIACLPGLAIIEGRFLRYVLGDIAQVVLVELTCSLEERRGRHALRTLQPLDEQDRVTDRMLSLVYGKPGKLIARHISLPTDGIPTAEVVQRILAYVRDPGAH